jgi:hypothetical protein
MSFLFHSGGGQGPSILYLKWKAWDEATQDTMACADCYCALFDAPGAGDDETGAGFGLTGADLVLTETGTVPGVSAGYRQLAKASNQWFRDNDGILGESCYGASTNWTVILKYADATKHATESSYLFAASEDFGVLDERISVHLNTDGTWAFVTDQDNGGADTQTSTGQMHGSSGWLAIWSNGTAMKAGIGTTRPMVVGDFDEVLTSAYAGNYVSETFARTYLGTWNNGATYDCDIKLAYVIFANACFF